MKKIVCLSVIALLGPVLTLHAYDFESNGIYYNIIQGTKNVEVTHDGSYENSYNGDVIIPEKIIFDGVNYSVLKIGSYAFWNCNRLTSIIIPNTITDIEDWSFQGCKNLTSIILHDILTSIGSRAFSDSGLTSVKLPNSLISIGGGAFSNSKLTSIDIPNSVTTMDGNIFSGCHELKSIIIPGSVKKIPFCSFFGCNSLKSIIIPDGIETIGDEAFRHCLSLESIFIAKSVSNIGYNTFRSCIWLKSVEVQWGDPKEVFALDDIFEDVILWDVELIVPKGTEHLYAKADVWKNFGNITSVANELIVPIDAYYSNGVLHVRNEKVEMVNIYSMSGQLV